MQPTVRRARRTADTRGYAHRERAARWGRPRPEHPPGFIEIAVEIAGCGLKPFRSARVSDRFQFMKASVGAHDSINPSSNPRKPVASG